ncbi:MAG TPA: hypothetical protein VGF94_16965 [Kofleriaceae bacterium]
MVKVALAIVAAACGAHAAEPRVPANLELAGDDIVLFRDVAELHQRVPIEVGASGTASARVAIAAGVSPQSVRVEASDGVELRRIDADAAGVLHVDVAARPGHHVLVLGYITDRMHWDAAYTLATDAARERASLGGAIAIRNETGLVLDARVRVADANHTAQPRASRDLGRRVLPPGETRVELLADQPPRLLRRVFVYDPIGTKWDHASGLPLRTTFGGQPVPATVTESFELERDPRATAALPAGPVRLVETRTDGTLALLGEARLFDAAARVAGVDTIPIGTAEGVTATRTRRELTIDDDRQRIVEEIELAVTNARAVPVEMVLREHMYRGLTWTLVYDSTRSAAKEGPQQIALRVLVPAHARQRILYVVRYWWEP